MFLGNCDLTLRQGQFFNLRHNSDSIAVSYLQSQIHKYIKFVSEFPSVKLIFLEIVPHSIQKWNKSGGNKEPKIFLQQDIVFYERICLINDYCIRQVNYNAGVKSPNLRTDLMRYRKDKLSDSCRISVNYINYLDGIYPGPLLARCWMKQIIAYSFTHCI